MKSLLSLLTLLFGFSAMPNTIICNGQNTSTIIMLSLTGKAFPLDRAEYRFENRLIPTSDYEFGINSNKDDQSQELKYKFRTLKKHSLAKKNSNLVLTIRQNSVQMEPYIFILNETHEAELKIEVNGGTMLIDKMNCRP